MKASVFNNYFLYTDQYLTIFSQSLQCILFTGVIVISVSVLLLPDTVSAVSAVLSIVSTLTGQNLSFTCTETLNKAFLA